MLLTNKNFPLPLERLEKEDLTISFANATWDDFEKLYCEEDFGYRVSYLNGVITIVSPSKNHEVIADIISDLIKAFCRRFNILYFPMGSTTLTNKPLAGKEPDASFTFGEIKDIPDLAIEVAFSSGSLEDLEKYKLLNVKEVWLWKNEKLRFFVLNKQRDDYEEKERSFYLHNLSAEFLIDFVNRSLTESPLTIEKDFNKALSAIASKIDDVKH
ncbi:Uma2 family endonuclease [Myxosarcina sp. GI1]|uniref:Uma2 family endonuclease n=1 Tax=Myxosarcina sp. GI1 TaxID=1541065 RepID=UPI00068CE1DA|nr:Uma2 family endonuclease [Myxosarcina sp. GI1]